MARRKLTLQDRIKGARALLRSTKKVPEHLKKGARTLLAKNGYAVALAFALLLALPAHAQREQVRYTSQFAGTDVATKITAAQNSCISDTAVPCIVITDSTLAVFPTGSMPTPCTQCLWLDYRTIGKIQYASAAQTTLADFGLPVSFPLLAVVNTGCTTPTYSFATSATWGIARNTVGGAIDICLNGNAIISFRNASSQGLTMASGAGFCYSSSATNGDTGADTCLWRGAANQVNCGNGTAADRSCALLIGTLNASGAITVASCTGCGSAPTPAILSGQCSGTFTASGNIGLYGLGELGATTCTVTETAVGEMPMPSAGTIKNLRVVCGTAGAGAGSGVVVVKKNNTNQATTCTVGTGTTCSDTSNTFAVAAGDTVGLNFATGVGETLANCRATVEKL